MTERQDDSVMLPELELSSSAVALPELSDFEASTWEYELMGLSAAGQFLRHYRPMLAKLGAMTTAQVKQQSAGRRVRAHVRVREDAVRARIVDHRERPPL